jgi:chemotaxis signal transduction protein
MFRDGPERLLVFRVGPERFALALTAVDEVIDAPSVQPLPDSAATVRGFAALRGELVSIFDPRPLLNVGGDAHGAVLLFERDGRRIGLAIDDVYDAITVEEADLRSVPGSEAADGVLVGVVRRGSDLVAVLDAKALLDRVTMEGEKE